MVRPSSLLLLVLLIAPGWAAALGLGEIKLGSNLNQRLQAEIPLYSVRPNDVEGMRIALASPELFRRAGVERAFHLTRIKFNVVDNGDGTGSLRLSTDKVVNEPFLNFLLEVQWPNGRLVREFTLLLDPPVYGAAISSTIARSVPTVRPTAPAPRELGPSPFIGAAPASPFNNQQNKTPRVVTAPRATSAPAPAVRQPANTVPGRYGPVKRSDTLWSLASRLRPDNSVTVHQMMMALLRANPQAFINNNVNALRAGTILRVPERAEVASIDQQQALADIRQQNTNWEDVRRTLAANPPRQPTQPAPAARSDANSESATAAVGSATDSTSSDTTGSAAADTPADTPATTEAEPDGQLRIVGAAAGDALGAGESEQLSRLGEQIDLVKEELAQSRAETGELTSKLTQAESIITDMERLAQIRDDQLAQLQQQLSQTQTALEQAASKLEAASDSAATVPASTQTESGSAPAETETATASTDAGTATATDGASGASSSEGSSTDTQASESGASGADSTSQTGQQTAQSDPAPAATAGGADDKPKPTIEIPPVAPQPTGIVDQVMAAISGTNPSVLVGAGGGIVLLLGLTMFLRGRRAASDESGNTLEEVMLDNAASDDDARTQFGALDQDGDETEMPRTEMLFDEANTQTVAGIDEDDVDETTATIQVDPGSGEDPLQEANVYLAYERFDQAEEIVKKAIEAEPNRPEYQLKLLEIYHGMGNREAFDATTATLEEQVGAESALMDSARALAADFPVAPVGGDTGVDSEPGALADSGDLDFDLGFGTDESDNLLDPEEQTLDRELDFDLSSLPAADAGGQAVDPSDTSVDFVLDTADSGPEVEGPSTQVGSGTDIDFDLGSGTETTPASSPEGDTHALDFDLAFGTEDTVDDNSAPIATAAALGAAGAAAAVAASSVDFDLDFLNSESDNEDLDSDTRPDLGDGDTSLDMGMDFGSELSGDTTDTESMQAAVPEAFETVQLDADEIDLDLDEGLELDDSLRAVASETVLGSVDDAVDLNLDGGREAFDLASGNTLEAVLVPGDGSGTAISDPGSADFGLSEEDTGADDSGNDLFDTVSLGPTTDTLEDEIALEIPSSTDEETAEVAFGLGDDKTAESPSSATLDAEFDDIFDLSESDDSSDLEDLLTLDDGVEDFTGDTVDTEELLSFDDDEVDGGDFSLDVDESETDVAEADDLLELPDDMSADTGDISVQMPGDDGETSEFARPAIADASELDFDAEDTATQQQEDFMLELPVGDDEETGVIDDLLLVEETADTSGIVLEPDAFDADDDEARTETSSGLSSTFEAGDSNDTMSGFVMTDDEATTAVSLEEAFEAAADADAEDELTVDLESNSGFASTVAMQPPDFSDDDAPASGEEEIAFDLDFDSSVIPDEALQTQTHLSGVGLAEPDDDLDVPSEPTMILGTRGPGLGADTADLGIASEIDVPDGAADSLDLDFGLLDEVPTSTDTVVGEPTLGTSTADEDPDDELDFDLTDFDPLAESSVPVEGGQTAVGLGTIDDEDEDETAVLGNALSGEVDAVQTQLDLAQEFIQLGDGDAAREALEEVVADGNEAQQAAARSMLEKLSS